MAFFKHTKKSSINKYESWLMREGGRGHKYALAWNISTTDDKHLLENNTASQECLQQLPASVLISSHPCSVDELHNTSQEHLNLSNFSKLH